MVILKLKKRISPLCQEYCTMMIMIMMIMIMMIMIMMIRKMILVMMKRDASLPGILHCDDGEFDDDDSD